MVFCWTQDSYSYPRNRIITGHLSHASVLGLNALLVESTATLTEHFAAETPSVICQGIVNKDVSLTPPHLPV